MLYLFTLLLASTALASPLVPQLDSAVYCNTYDTAQANGLYNLYLNLWGAKGVPGTQCANLLSANNDAVSWKTTWVWAIGSGKVKSFANVNPEVGLNKQLSNIMSILTTWKWHMTYSGVFAADVAYDLFTSSSVGGSNEYELMVWLGNFNAGPISYKYTIDGHAIPVTSSISLEGYTWNLYRGNNGYNEVFSFLPASRNVTSFKGDLYPFFSYLMNNQGLPSTQYLITAQGGTEPFYGGPVTFETISYSLVID